MFLVSLLALTAVSAAENATADIASVDENAIEELDIPTEEISKSSQTMTDLNDTINNNTESEISLNSDYAYVDSDSGLKEGIEINRDLTINGNGHTIDGGGKARLFHVTSGNVIFKNLTFVNGCTGTWGYGGAIWADSYVKAVNCNFTNNNAHFGGAISNALAENCTFEHNQATRGGAIYLNEKKDETITSCNFVENTAKTDFYETGIGGAILLWNCEGIKVSDCTFVKNSGELNGGAIYAASRINNKVYNCIFVNNTAGSIDGSAIYWTSLYGEISNCIFLNNENRAIYSSEFLNTNNNWFGNTAINYDKNSTVSDKVNMTKWLFLNATADSDSIEVLSTSNITFDLYLYDSDSGAISKYDASLLKPINLNITSEKGDVDKNIANFNETIKYTATAGGTGRVTAKWENVEYSIKVCNIKLNPNLSAESQEAPYSKNTIMTLKFNDIATGRVNVTLKGKKYNQTFTDLDLNSAISLANVLVDEYNVTVTYSGDERFLNSTANATLKVTKSSTDITSNPVRVTYKNDDYLIATLKDINGNPLSGFNVVVGLNDCKTYVTDKNGQIKVAVGSLVPKTYYVKITFKGNGNYAETSKEVKVTVKKANPKLAAKAKKFKKSLKTKKYTVTLKGNTGKAIKKVKLTLKIKGKTYTARTNNKGKAIFKIKKLTKKGTFKAKITFKGNKYYNKITKTVKIKIK